MDWTRRQFTREFRDLHGNEVAREYGRQVSQGESARMSLSEAVARLAIGSMGLFFAIVLICVAIAMLTVGFLFAVAIWKTWGV